MTKNRSSELKFIKERLTELNPKDIYYKNMFKFERIYYIMCLIGMLMVGYLILW